jgi:hypothetical protein
MLESKKSANQKQESPVAAMFVNGSGHNEQSSIDASYQQAFKQDLQVLCCDCSFRSDPLTNMATTDNSCF